MKSLAKCAVLTIALWLLSHTPSFGAEPFAARFGAPSSWGEIGSNEHLTKLEHILDDRTQYAVSLARTDLFVIQDDAGDALGGGGTGSMSSPFKCRDSNDLRDLILARSAPFVCFRLKGEFRSPGPTGRGLRVISTGAALRPWPEDSQGWMVSAFTRHYGAQGWTAQDLGSSTLYSRIDPEPVYWVKIGNTDADVDRYPCRSVANLSLVSSAITGDLARWFYDTDAQTLYVNLPNHLIASGNVSIETAEPMKHTPHVNGQDLNGIKVLDFDGVLIEGGLIEGFGFDRQSNGNWPMLLDSRGSNLIHVKDCKVRFGWYHTIGGLSNGGGIRVYENVTVSYCRPAPAGVGGAGLFTSFVDYAANGGHEVYIDGMHFVNGTLPDKDWGDARRASPLYGHSISWSFAAALSLRRNVTVRDTPLSGFQTVQSLTGVEYLYDAASRRDAGNYRHFAIDEDVRLTELTSAPLYLPSSFAAHYNCDWRFEFKAPTSARSLVASSDRFRGAFVNCRVEAVASPGNWTNSSLGLVSYNPTDGNLWNAHSCDWVHSAWVVRAEPGAVGVKLNISPSLIASGWTRNGCGWFNHTFTVDGGSFAPRVNLPEGDPFVGTGSSGCVYAATAGLPFPAADVDQNINALLVGQPWEPVQPSDIPASMLFARSTRPLPTGLRAEFDALRAPRVALLAPGRIAPAPELGACCVGLACSHTDVGTCADLGGTFLGQSSACVATACQPETPCPGNYNGNGSVDLLDLLAFNGDWSSNLGTTVPNGTLGDYNGNGIVDLLDLLAFNSDWSSNLGQTCP